MKVAIFHGSPRKGNTYKATRIFLDALQKHSDVQCTEFFLPEALPVFCLGCQVCFSHPSEKCPHAQYVTPLLEALLQADALVFATPHHGACSMSAGMKTLLDHLDFLTLNVLPRSELFGKKAFVLTTAAGSAAAIAPIRRYLKNWGVNRVDALGIRLFTDQWDKMPLKKKQKTERKLQKAADAFYHARKRRPYLSTLGMYYMSKFILKKYVGKDAYPYQHWVEKGFFAKRPF